MGGYQPARAPQGRWFKRHEMGRYDEIIPRGDDKQTGTGLRHEKGGVDDNGPAAVSPLGKSGTDGGEIPSPVRGKGSANIFDGDDPGRAAFPAQGLHELPKWPEHSRPVTPKTGAAARKG